MKIKVATALLSIFSALSASAELREVSVTVHQEVDIQVKELVEVDAIHAHGAKYTCYTQFGSLHHYGASGECTDLEDIRELQDHALRECKKAHHNAKHRCHDRGCLVVR